jgi:hypothetical protein
MFTLEHYCFWTEYLQTFRLTIPQNSDTVLKSINPTVQSNAAALTPPALVALLDGDGFQTARKRYPSERPQGATVENEIDQN